MLKIMRICLLVGLAYYVAGKYDLHMPKSEASTPAPQAAAAAQATTVQSADADYINNYLKGTNEGRSFSFGTTTQMLQLPSGAAMVMTVQKTQTGWCPIRKEPTFTLNINWTQQPVAR